MESVLTKKQTREWVSTWTEGNRHFRMVTTARYDDQCGNGHNTFSITASAKSGPVEGSYPREEFGGCCHDEIVNRHPELAPYIKWHLCSSDGPMHYLGNAIYLAGDRDCWGLRKGETHHIRKGGNGPLCWILEPTAKLPRYVDGDTPPSDTATLRYVPLLRVGEGKPRELDKARDAAIWPDATDEDLTAPGLKERLEARLPALLVEFKAAMESLGFTY